MLFASKCRLSPFLKGIGQGNVATSVSSGVPEAVSPLSSSSPILGKMLLQALRRGLAQQLVPQIRAVSTSAEAYAVAKKAVQGKVGPAQRRRCIVGGLSALCCVLIALPSCVLPLAQLLIDGKFVDSSSGKTLPIVDPTTEREFLQVAAGDANDVNKVCMCTSWDSCRSADSATLA